MAVNYSNEVLAIGVGARALGMGGAFVSVADDSTAVYWNPAGLTRISSFEVSAVQQGQNDKALSSGLNEVGSRYFFLSGGMNFGKTAGSLGVSVMRFGVDGITQTKVDPSNPNGPPIEVGKFATEDLGGMLSYGYQIHKSFGAGLTVKYLTGGTTGVQADPSSGVMGNARYSYIGTDLGMRVDFGGMTPSLEGLALGLNLQDALNTGVAWSNTPTNRTDAVDLNAKVGFSYSPPFQFLKESKSQLTIAYDADPKYGSNMLHHLGGEFWYKETLAFRGGVRQFAGGLQAMEATLGASFRLYFLQVDYGFVNYELTPIHYLSLSVKM
jgi:hypothetical protein